MTDFFNIDHRLAALAEKAEQAAEKRFGEINKTAEYNGAKVLKAFIDNKVSESCLKGTTGYGYGDIGRETLDAVYAQAFCGEDAVVRHNFVNGTHTRFRLSAACKSAVSTVRAFFTRLPACCISSATVLCVASRSKRKTASSTARSTSWSTTRLTLRTSATR